ncbi:MAG TPA: hypothetical protein DCY20_07470, partial [Firmicutes bacterium]|nr:hypothetical protein [Bacillota bacterium]
GMYLTLKFTGNSMMTNHRIQVNGKNTAYAVTYESGEELHLKFKINSLNDGITISTTVLGMMNVSFRVVLDQSTLVKLSGQIPTPEVELENSEVQDSFDSTSSSTNTNQSSNHTNSGTTSTLVSVGELVDGGKYSLKNEIVTESAMGYQAARLALNSTTYLELKNGAYYITLGFGQLDIMQNVRIYINNSQVTYETLRSTSTSMDVRIKLGSLSDQIKVKVYVPAMGRDTEFGVKLLTNTIYLVTDAQLNQSLGSTTGNVSNLMDTNLTEEETLGEELVLTEYMKRYVILNEVLSSSQTGLEMARKYLEEQSLIEEVDGSLYLSLTFSGTDLMNQVAFTVNEEAVSHEVTFVDEINHVKTYRMMIGNITDAIEVSMHVIPMGMNISFGIKLLPDTMMLIEEDTVIVENMTNIQSNTEVEDVFETEDTEINKNEPVTVGFIAYVALIITAVGGFIAYKKRQQKKNSM